MMIIKGAEEEGEYAETLEDDKDDDGGNGDPEKDGDPEKNGRNNYA